MATWRLLQPSERVYVQKAFDGMNYNAAGSPYAMEYRDAQVFNAPYEQSAAASAAIAATMEKVI